MHLVCVWRSLGVHQVMKIRQMLTEVLLEVTNQEIESVASESIEEANSKSHTHTHTFMHTLCVLYIMYSLWCVAEPKLVIQMKELAANVPNKENRQLLGKTVCCILTHFTDVVSIHLFMLGCISLE